MDKRFREEAATYSLITAANFVKRSSRAILARGETGTGTLATQRDCLIEWFKNRGEILDQGYCRQHRHIGGGAEHEVFFDLAQLRAIKSTHPNQYGWSVAYQYARATPLEYLRRLVYQNWFLGDDIRLLGGIVGDDHFEIVTSQPWIYGDATSPPASDDQIEHYFAAIGFKRSEQFEGEGFFYSPQFNVVAADAHSRNVIVSSKGDVVPIDVVMGRPGPALETRLRQELQSEAQITATTAASTAGIIETFVLDRPAKSEDLI